MVDYTKYQHIRVEKRDGIVLLTMNRPEVLNATNARLHYELAYIWNDIGADPEARVAILTGAGEAFSAGGDFDLIEAMASNPDLVARMSREAADLVYNILNLDKPVISAVNGVAVGAGLAAALASDIVIASEKARFTDGHVRLGVAAGDHACMIWPLAMGMAKAKYYLLTCEFLDAREAERLGLVSLVVPHEDLMPTAWKVAERLARGPQYAIRFTKRALNQWFRLAGIASFDYSLALEMLNFTGADVREGVRSLREKRPPAFPSAQS